MKKIIISILLIITALNVNADEKSKEILSKLTSTIKSYGSYEVIFTATMPGEFNNISGKFIVQGNKFFLNVYDSEIYSDGKIRYTYNKIDNEVIIENNNSTDKNILSNPSQIFTLYEQDFIHTYKGESTVELKPKENNGVFSSITLKINANTALPTSISYNLSGINATMNMVIIKVIPNIKTSAATFIFDKSKHKDVEVIDFR